MAALEREVRELLPAIDINVGGERLRFMQGIADLARSELLMTVELYNDTFGQDGLHFANFLLPGSSDESRSGGQLIVRPDEKRVCVEMRSANWTSDHPSRNQYVEFSREVFGPLLRLYNKEHGKRYRMRVQRPRRIYQLPPRAGRLFERFAVLANTRSLHALDWERFYAFVRHSRREAPEGALRPLLSKRGFSDEKAQMLSELYHHLWAFKKLRP